MTPRDLSPIDMGESDRSLYMWNIEGHLLSILAIDEEGEFSDGRPYLIVKALDHSEDGRAIKVLINKDYPLRQIRDYFVRHPEIPLDSVAFQKVKPRPPRSYQRWELVPIDGTDDIPSTSTQS